MSYEILDVKRPDDVVDVSYADNYVTPELLPKAICMAGEVVAYLFATIDGKSMYVNFFEVVDDKKEEGHGTEIVDFLFKHYELQCMTGKVMIESGLRAYYFWESLGSDLSIPLDEIEYFDFESDIDFVLEKNV